MESIEMRNVVIGGQTVRYGYPISGTEYVDKYGKVHALSGGESFGDRVRSIVPTGRLAAAIGMPQAVPVAAPEASNVSAEARMIAEALRTAAKAITDAAAMLDRL